MTPEREQHTTGELRVIQSLDELSKRILEMTTTYDAEREEVAGSVEAFRAELGPFRDQLREVREQVDALQKALVGHIDGKPGLHIRFDRLEQIEAQRSWREKAIWGCIIGLIGKVLLDVIIK